MEIKHDKGKRFYVVVDGMECVAEYCETEDGVMDFCHTYVPDALRGRGIAKELLDAAARYLEENNMKAKASCSYAHAYFEKYNKELLA